MCAVDTGVNEGEPVEELAEQYRKLEHEEPYREQDDEDINYNTRTSTSAAPEAFQAPPTPPGAPPLQAQAPSPTLGPITRARARELNYIMLLKNEGPKE